MKARYTFQGLEWGVQGRRRRHPLIAGVLILALVAQFGCASSGTDKRLALEQLPSLQKDAGLHVAVTSGRFVPEFDIIKGDAHSIKEQLLLAALSPLIGALFIQALLLVPIYQDIIKPEESADERAERTKWAIKIWEREATVREMVASQRIQDDLLARVIVIGGKMTPHGACPANHQLTAEV